MNATDLNAAGTAQSALGREERALLYYERALQLDSDSAPAWHNMALSLQALGEYKDALRAVERALDIDAQSARAWTNKGSILEALGRDDDALRCYTRALEVDPHCQPALTNKALLEEARGDRSAATSTWEAYLAAAREDESQSEWTSQVSSRLAGGLTEPAPVTGGRSLLDIEGSGRTSAKMNADAASLLDCPTTADPASNEDVHDPAESDPAPVPAPPAAKSPRTRSSDGTPKPKNALSSRLGWALVGVPVLAALGVLGAREFTDRDRTRPQPPEVAAAPGPDAAPPSRDAVPNEEADAPTSVARPPRPTSQPEAGSPRRERGRAPGVATVQAPSPSSGSPVNSRRRAFLVSGVNALNNRRRTEAIHDLTLAADPARGTDREWQSAVQLLAHVHAQQSERMAGAWMRWGIRTVPEFAYDSSVFRASLYRAARDYVASTPEPAGAEVVQTTWEWMHEGEEPSLFGNLRVEPVNMSQPLQVSVQGMTQFRSGQVARLQAGSYRIRARAPGYQPIDVTREVLPNATTVVRLRLSRARSAVVTAPDPPAREPSTAPGEAPSQGAPEPEILTGMIQVRVTPWAIVSIDGVRLGRRTQFVDTLTAGIPHRLRFEREGVVRDARIELEPGETRRITIRFP